MQKCLNCNNEFTQKRNTGRYCSTSCRTKYNLALQKAAPIATPKPQTFNTSLMGVGLSGNPAFDMYLGDVKNELNLLRQKYESLKTKYETLKETHNDLKLDVATKDKLSEADKAIESSKGLGGIVEKVTSNERLMDMLEGVLISKFGNKEEESENILDGVENKELITLLINQISDQDETFIAQIIKMTEYYKANPILLTKSIKAITSNPTQTTTQNEN